MPSFEVLSWGSLTKLSPFEVQRDFFDLALKPSEDSDSFRVALSQLEKPFKYLSKVFLQFPKTSSYIQVQCTITKISLSVNCTLNDECVHLTHIGHRNKLLKSQNVCFNK